MWNVIAWVLQGLLAAVFLFHGIMYTVSPAPMVRSMREQGHWPPALPSWFRVFIGAAELLAALGLVLPGLLHLLTFFTPLAAVGLAVVMIGAIVYHVRRREVAVLPGVALLLILTVAVAVIRWQVAALH